MSLTVIGSELAELAVANDGATYDPIPGVQSHEEGEGTLNQRQVKAFEGVRLEARPPRTWPRSPSRPSPTRSTRPGRRCWPAPARGLS